MDTTGKSEVARIRAEIEREYQAAQWGQTGLSVGTAKHLFINRRMERIDGYHEQLTNLIGEQASIAIVAAVFEGDSSRESR